MIPALDLVDGSIHPLNLVVNQIVDFFKKFNFTIVNYPELVTTKHCFDDLNIPLDHPGRSKTDTFYVSDKQLLRTHCTAGTIERLLLWINIKIFVWLALVMFIVMTPMMQLTHTSLCKWTLCGLIRIYLYQTLSGLLPNSSNICLVMILKLGLDFHTFRLLNQVLKSMLNVETVKAVVFYVKKPDGSRSWVQESYTLKC